MEGVDYPVDLSPTKNVQEKTSTQDDSDSEDVERELTQKFLSGKLSFTEYTAQMENEEAEEIIEEPSTSTNVVKPKQKEKRTRIRRTLPTTLKGLVGEANLRFARGN